MQRIALTMEENQQAATGVMKRLDELCKQLGLRYTLTYGTMLGAIRHKGYIPWDDDLDIMLPRPDYDRLIRWCLDNPEQLEPYRLFTPETVKDYPYTIPRLSDSRYEIETDNEKDCGMGAFVDIYPLDGIGNDPGEALAILCRRARWSSLHFLSTRLRCEKGMTKSWLKRILKLPAFWVAKLMGKQFFGRRLLKMAEGCDWENSTYVGCVIWDTETTTGLFKKEWFENTEPMEFQGERFQVSTGYHEIMSTLYGDYMKLPPEEDRVAHHFYKIYRK